MVKKSTIPKTNAQAFHALLADFAVTGDKRDKGYSALADALGVSRQIVHRWETHGIPLKYKTRLCGISGRSEKWIWPEGFKY